VVFFLFFFREMKTFIPNSKIRRKKQKQKQKQKQKKKKKKKEEGREGQKMKERQIKGGEREDRKVTQITKEDRRKQSSLLSPGTKQEGNDDQDSKSEEEQYRLISEDQ